MLFPGSVLPPHPRSHTLSAPGWLVSGVPIGRLVGWLARWMSMVDWWLVRCQWLVGWLGVDDWMVDWLVGWLAIWLFVCLVGWLVGSLVCLSLFGWLVGWLVGWLHGWLVGWLAGWLVGWLVGWLGVSIVDSLVGWVSVYCWLVGTRFNRLAGCRRLIRWLVGYQYIVDWLVLGWLGVDGWLVGWLGINILLTGTNFGLLVSMVDSLVGWVSVYFWLVGTWLAGCRRLICWLPGYRWFVGCFGMYGWLFYLLVGWVSMLVFGMGVDGWLIDWISCRLLIAGLFVGCLLAILVGGLDSRLPSRLVCLLLIDFYGRSLPECAANRSY